MWPTRTPNSALMDSEDEKAAQRAAGAIFEPGDSLYREPGSEGKCSSETSEMPAAWSKSRFGSVSPCQCKQGYNYSSLSVSCCLSKNWHLKGDFLPIVSPKLLLVYSCSPLCWSNANNTGMSHGLRLWNHLRKYKQPTWVPRAFKTTCPTSQFIPSAILQQMATTFGPPLPVELPCHHLMALTRVAWQSAIGCFACWVNCWMCPLEPQVPIHTAGSQSRDGVEPQQPSPLTLRWEAEHNVLNPMDEWDSFTNQINGALKHAWYIKLCTYKHRFCVIPMMKYNYNTQIPPFPTQIATSSLVVPTAFGTRTTSAPVAVDDGHILEQVVQLNKTYGTLPKIFHLSSTNGDI